MDELASHLRRITPELVRRAAGRLTVRRPLRAHGFAQDTRRGSFPA